MLTGTYTCMLQTIKINFNQAEVDLTCLICKLEAEDSQHLPTSCPAYTHLNFFFFKQITEYMVSKIGRRVWTNCCNNTFDITELLIDRQSFVENNILSKVVQRT